MTLSDHDLDELEALATPGKWSAVPSINEPERLTVQTETVPLRRDDANRNTLFVVALHNAFPALIAEVRRLREIAAAADDVVDCEWVAVGGVDDWGPIEALRAALTEEEE